MIRKIFSGRTPNASIINILSSTDGDSRHETVRCAIVAALVDAVKQVQYAVNERDETKEALEAVCDVMEAMLLHGVKDTLGVRMKRVMADFDEMPKTNFWAPIMVVSHRGIIDQINSLTCITTEIGQCRAWLRLTLNDRLLSSYLTTLANNSTSAVRRYYRPYAFIRDNDTFDVARRLVEDVEMALSTSTNQQSKLSYNSSLLNSWPIRSLYLAGIWAPTLKTCPVAPCDDVARDISAATPTPTPPSAPSSRATNESMHESPLRRMVALNEDEVLRIILKDNDGIVDGNLIGDEGGGNAVSVGKGWSFEEKNMQLNEQQYEIVNDMQDDVKDAMEGSFNALIESYNNLNNVGNVGTPDLGAVWKKLDDLVVDREELNENMDPIVDDVDVEPMELSRFITEIAREKGLDFQNYQCADCRMDLCILEDLNVCAFTGNYFCNNCIHEKPMMIPARIIHNYDFKYYTVSKKSYNYLDEHKMEPIIDFKITNPLIYTVNADFAILQSLRTQLNYLRAYLYTCHEPIIEEFRQLVTLKEYLYEHVHCYAICDLYDISDGKLLKILEKAVEFGKTHVMMDCWLCSQKGFVCEICNQTNTIFPFDIQNVYRCNECNAVYHKHCLDALKPCPKCERLKKKKCTDLLDLGF